MKKTFLFIFISFFSINVFSQVNAEINELLKRNIKGNVKKMKFLKYEVNYVNDSTYVKKIEDFILPSNYILFFDKKGRKIKKVELRLKNDNLIEKGAWYYTYKNDRIKKEVYYWNNRSKDSTVWFYEYPNKTTQLITKKHFTSSSLFDSPRIHFYSYKRKGNKEYFKSYNSDSSFVQRRLFTYDKYNRIMRIENYEDKDYLMDITFKTYRDSSSRNPYQVVSSYTKYDEPRPAIIRYRYNKYGDAIKIINLSFPNEKRIGINKYIYDSKGNWVKKVMKGTSGKVYRIYKREFTYYD